MKTVLIVDDEAPIREWLEMCVKQSGSRFKAAGLAKDGMEALEMIDEKMPDIVFLDITMPKKNGLEVLKTIQEKYSSIKVALLTCHDDFNYARTAIKYGAVDYLLKNELDKEIVWNLLDRLANIIDEEETDIQYNQKSFDVIVRGNYLRNIIESKDAKSLSNKDLKEYRIPIDNSPFFAVSFTYNEELLDRLELHKKDYLANQIIFFYSRGIVVFVSNIVCEGTSCILYFDKLISEIKKLCGTNVGYSDFHSDTKNLIKAINEAISMREYLFYFPENTNINNKIVNFRDFTEFRDSSIKNEKEKKLKIFNYKTQIIEAYKTRGKESSYALFKEMFHYLLDNKIADVEFVVYSVYDVVERIYSSVEANSRDIKILRKEIINSENIFALQKIIKNFYANLNDTEKYSISISKAIDYIRNNYHKQITLTDVAEIACLNEEYFSRLFKKEVGCNFTEYLNDIRMNIAEKLIKTTNLKVSEIANMVGIPNSAYFSSLFKKRFKLSPSAIRNDMDIKKD